MFSATRSKSASIHATAHTSLALLLSLPMPATTMAQVPASAYLRRVRDIPTRQFGMPHPQGLTFSRRAEAFFVLAAANTAPPSVGASKLVMITGAKDLAGAVDLTFDPATPMTMAFDDRRNRLLFYDAPAQR